MKASYKTSDFILEELVRARREEVVRLQRMQAEQIADLEAHGQARLADLRNTLSKDVASALDGSGCADADQMCDGVRYAIARLSRSRPSPENETAPHPGDTGSTLSEPDSPGWLTPCYGMLHGADGRVCWQDCDPGSIDLSGSASGSGSGIFGTGSAASTVCMDWWFRYRTLRTRSYGHAIWVPFHGFYVLHSDDGFWNSKETRARIDLSAAGYQYYHKGTGSTNVFDIGSQNIDAHDRFDGWRTMRYTDLLAADQAYLRVTATIYVYARGGGSIAQLNFGDGEANCVGMPWIYVG